MKNISLMVLCIVLCSCDFKSGTNDVETIVFGSKDGGKTIYSGFRNVPQNSKQGESNVVFKTKEFDAPYEYRTNEIGGQYQNRIGWDNYKTKKETYYLRWQSEVKDNQVKIYISTIFSFNLLIEKLNMAYLYDVDRQQKITDFHFLPGKYNLVLYLQEPPADRTPRK